MIFHAWSLYPFGTLTWWWYWLIHLLVLAYWFCSSHDYLTYFGMYIHIVVYLVCLNVDYPACILSWSYLSMLSLLLFILIIVIFSFSFLCGHGWYTCSLHDCLVHDCSFPMCLHVACLCGLHIYPLTSNLLVLAISFFLVFAFASMRPCVYLFL